MVARALLGLCGLVAGGLALGAGQDPAPAAKLLQDAHDLARVGDAHRLLAKLAGGFDVVLDTLVPDGGTRSGAGRIEARTVLGGRYVVLSGHLRVQDTDLEVLQILGYDTLQQQFTSSWRDDRSTWAVEAVAAADDVATGRLRYRGSLRDATAPDGRAFRFELDLRDPDHVTLRAFDGAADSDRPTQTQHWTRR